MISILLRALSYWKPYKKEAAFIIFCLTCQAMFDAYFALSMKAIIDMLAHGKTEKFKLIMLLLTTGFVVSTVAGMLGEYLIGRASSLLLNDIRRQLFDHLQSLSMDFFGRAKASEIASRFGSDLNAIDQLLTVRVTTALIAVLSLAIYLPIMIGLNWKLATLMLVLLPGVLVGQRLFAGPSTTAGDELKQANGEFNAHIQEIVQVQPAIKVFGLGQAFKTRFVAQLDKLGRLNTRAGFFSGMVLESSAASVRVLRLAIIGVGGYLVFEHEMTAGTLVAFTSVLIHIMSSVTNLNRRFFLSVLKSGESFRRIDEILQVRPQVEDRPDALAMPRLQNAIRLETVSFAYAANQPILKGVSLVIPAGYSIAIVGPSGSGKSTLLSLIARLYDAQSGAILFDDQPITQCTQASLRSQMSMVFQEAFLFSLSIGENIRLGKTDATEAEVEAAARAAAIHDWIVSLPDGYATMVNELGARSLGWQRQRMAIARAIIRDPAILLLDEASSALDPVNESAINDTLRRLGQSRTVVNVTHRLASAQAADLIFVMNEGRVVEQGKHADLLALRGQYAELWEKQHGFHLNAEQQTMSVTPERLKRIALFADVGLDTLSRLTTCFITEHYEAGQVVFRQGDLGDKFYIVVRGKVEVLLGDEQRIGILEDGDIFGEIALLTDNPRNATVRAMDATVVIALPREQFSRFIEDEPAARGILLALMQQRRQVR